VSCVEQLKVTKNLHEYHEYIIKARKTLGAYCLELNQQIQAKQAIDPIKELVENVHFEKHQPAILNIIGAYHLWIEEDYKKSSDHLHRSIKISKKIGDVVSESVANIYLGALYLDYSEFERSANQYSKALKLADLIQHIPFMIAIKSSIVAEIHVTKGEIEQSRYLSDEMQVRLNECDEKTKGFGRFALGFTELATGNLEVALKILIESHSLFSNSNQHLWSAVSAGTIANVLSEAGNFSDAFAWAKKAVELFERNSYFSYLVAERKLSKSMAAGFFAVR
jgi:tetratricopeptide (TPR) repeat protein